jgi:hypothetical protein
MGGGDFAFQIVERLVEVFNLARQNLAAGLHADEAGFGLREKLKHLRTLQLASHRGAIFARQRMNMKIILGPRSTPILINFFMDGLPSCGAPATTSWHANAVRGVAVGTVIADRPPHRSWRAVLPHRAPTLDD